MRNLMICLASVALFGMILFCSVGFAAVNDQMVVQGNVNLEPPQKVYIKNAMLDGEYGGSTASLAYFWPVLLQSSVTLGNDAHAEVRVRIDVKNNSKFEQTFNGIKYTEDMYDNALITVTTQGLIKGDVIPAGAEKSFLAVFTYRDGHPSQSNTLNSLLNFEFVVSSEFVPDAAVGNAVERFGEILNNSFDYEELVRVMNDTKESGRPNTEDGKTYIGNVIGSSGKDSQAVHDLFSKSENGALNDYLTLTVGDKTVDVTVIIKREDADNDPSTDDITLYLTPETPTGDYYTKIFGFPVDSQDRRPVLSPVYAVVFRNVDGKWVQITPLFEGKAGATVYGSPNGYNAKCDSFNTNTWESTQKYWNKNSGTKIKALTQAAISNGYTEGDQP